MRTSDDDSTSENRVCASCVGETFLKSLITAEGETAECNYCNATDYSFSIEQLADKVEQAFEVHYERTNPDPEYGERDGEPAQWAIANATEVDEEIAEDIREVLEDRHYDFELIKMGEECPFSSESHYEEKSVGSGEFPYTWEYFERGLRSESRFFSKTATSILDSIFSEIKILRTVGGAPVVVSAGPGKSIKSLYRARVFAEEDEKLKEALGEPWKHLGTPPTHAAGAGRMNAPGISVFYGAKSAKTALSEVRPPVGSKVAIARFQIIRRLHLLNLKALQSVAAGGSIFDPNTCPEIQKSNFLRTLGQSMARPIMPHEEASEYLPTQAVADYLAVVANLDGIIFPSVQAGRKSANVVLFHHAARVQEESLPKGTKLNTQLKTWDDDGSQPDYRVWEEAPVEQQAPATEKAPLWFYRGFDFDEHHDLRDPSLRVDLGKIKIHHIQAVSFQAESYSVERHRITKNPNIEDML